MIKRLKILMICIIGAMLLLLSLFLYARYIEPFRLTVTEISVTNENAESFTIAVFADTHFDRNYTPEDFEKVIDSINAEEPDIILFCGDLIDDYNRYRGDTEEISRSLAELEAPMGKFAVYGNHDHGGGAHRSYERIMADGGFEVLVNEAIVFGDIMLRLIGIDDFVLGNGDLEIVKVAADPDYLNLVFCHVPDVFAELSGYGVNFMIAAHSHGGQINIGQGYFPGLNHIFFPPYARSFTKGTYDVPGSDAKLHVNSGVGTTVLPVRFRTPPEITIVRVNQDM